MQAIILAGGLGTRLRDAVPDVPKPMAPINGRPFLEFLLGYWSAQGITRVVLSVGYKADTIQRHFGKRYGLLKIEYALEETPCGTGGGLLLATNHLGEEGPFLVLNGDTFFEVDLKAMMAAHLDKRAGVTMALLRVSGNSRYQGVMLGSDAALLALQGEPSTLESCLVNGGVYLFETSILIGKNWNVGDKLSLENDMFPAWIRGARRIYGYVSTGRFIDIGVPEDYHSASALLCDGPTVSRSQQQKP